MKQIFQHYTLWEDYTAGMFNISDIPDKDKKMFGAVQLLSEPKEFYIVMCNLTAAWPIATDVNLTNKSQNRRAWLGAAACMFKHSTPEFLTRVAWNLLNKQVQDKANEVADQIILEYENKTLNAETLFEQKCA